jgi:hypothetical protein
MSSIAETSSTDDSATPTRQFFDRYFTESISFPSNQVDAVIGFFQSRGFEKQSAAGVATVLLQQAKIDGIDVFELLQGLKSFDKIKLTALVTAILNANRSAVSKLGYRETASVTAESRNILI